MKKSELIQSFIASISMGIFIVGVSKLLNFVLKILVSQLGVTNFGDYYLATTTFISLTTIAALGIPMSTTRFISYLTGANQTGLIHKIISSAATATTAASIIVSVALYIYAETIAHIVGTPHIAHYLRILSFALIGSTTTLMIRAIFLGFIRIRLAYTTEAVDMLIKFIFTLIGILVFRMGVMGALAGYAIGTITAAMINIYVARRVTGINRLTLRVSRGFLGYTLPVSASEIITAGANILFLYIVRIRGGAETIGYYAAAVSIASLIHVLPQMILSVFLPIASAAYAQKKSIMPSYITLMLWLGMAVVLPSLVLIGLGKYFTFLVFGSMYASSIAILSTLIVAHGVYALVAWPNRQLLDMAGYTKENFTLTCLRVGISFGVLFTMTHNPDGTTLASAVLWGWVGESIGSVMLVKLKRLL